MTDQANTSTVTVEQFQSNKNKAQESLSTAHDKLEVIVRASTKWASQPIDTYDLVVNDLNEYITIQNYRKHIRTHVDILTQAVVKSLAPPSLTQIPKAPEPKKKGIFSKK